MPSPDQTSQAHQNLSSRTAEFQLKYDAFKKMGLSLDITRGKPSSAQLDLANGLLTLPGDHYMADGIDTRNYGGLDGLPQMKQLFGQILEIDPGNVIIGGNSSLTMMYDTLSRACQFGVPDGNGPWNQVPGRKFLCPTPGYDRHFRITEHLGFELVTIDISHDGPDMDQVEHLVAEDQDIKGIWCVPKYNNPTGGIFSEDTVRRLASMAAAADFRIMWDNAYAEHHLTDNPPLLANIMDHCIAAGTANRVVEFASTSKISHPGAGVAALAASDENIADAKHHLAVQTIGPDKINQLRHLNLFGNLGGLREHMQKHAALVKPRFDLVDSILTRELRELDIAGWTRPRGGYFISLDIPDGTARQVVNLAADAGVKLTEAGAPFPYGKDPGDRNIRIAPTFPELEEVGQATEVLVACVKLAASQQS
jgi:DNA-binding transcriptional MocR family regulator